MKSIFYILFFITGIANAQIVNIPDANFKSKLIQLGVDTNNNGEIEEIEAASTMPILNVSSSNISSLEGFQYFINVTNLFCNDNQLTTLNLSNNTSLTYVNCNNNQISTLNVDANFNLVHLLANNNQLTTINLPNHPNLENLWLFNNQLMFLNVNSCVGLKELSIGDNSLTTINLSMNTLLDDLNCSRNQLTNLDLTNNVNLMSLDCSFNNLITLNCSNNVRLTSLSFPFNLQLQNVFIKNGSIESSNINSGSWMENWFSQNSPSLEYICADDNQIDDIQGLVDSNVVVSSYCTFTPGGNYNTITGNVKFDAENNGCDVNDDGLPNIRVNINDGIVQGAVFSDANGLYDFYALMGSFDIALNIENPAWFTISPTSVTIPFIDNNNNTVMQDFCITANGVHSDLEVVITPITPARPGFEAVYKIVYLNKGNQSFSQQYGVNFFYNQNLMNYISSSILPSQTSAGSLSWDYDNLKPFESREILVTFAINTPTDTNPVNIGDEFIFTASILPQSGDENTIDNLFILNQTVVGSFDPNDITCLEGNMVSPTEIGNYLHYNIRFENTGTAPAENVVVKVEVNPLDFDINSLQLINTSHFVEARIKDNIVEFIFQNIMLESGGHGNVLLKVKSKADLQQGDLVEKKANIYFDYNFPVETNNVETVFQSLNNSNIVKDNTIKIYPNPTSSTVSISGDFTLKSIQLFDIQGRLLQANLVNKQSTAINLSDKSKGIYFIKVISEKGIKVEKLIKK